LQEAHHPAGRVESRCWIRINIRLQRPWFNRLHRVSDGCNAVTTSPIAFLALDQSMLDLARKTLAGRHDDVRLALGLMGEAVDVARRLAADGVEVVISRGVTASLIATALPDLPVVNMSTSPLDLATAIHKARKRTSRIAVLAFAPMSTGAAELGAMLGIDLIVRDLRREEDIEEALRAVRDEGAEIVVGGYMTARVAQPLGIECLPIETMPASIVSAVEEAKRIVHARSIEKAKSALLRAVLTFTDNGIVAVDRAGLVTLINPIASRMLRVGEADAVGRPVAAIWPRVGLDKVMASGKPLLQQLDRLFDQDFVCNKVPITAAGKTVGAVATLNDVRQIQRMEATVRKQILATGHVAAARFDDILGQSPALLDAIALAKDFAATRATVLIQGETGTGKELFAQSIHNASARSHGPFVAVNCAALPGHLLESELFGYVPGAFTGASQKGKPGLFELAHGGTIFLDEIAEIDAATQGKLLRVLQEKKVMRLGSDQVIPVDVRVVAATNKNLRGLVDKGAFRDDLYYRINVLQVRVPPLRERREDVAPLAQAFLKQAQPRSGRLRLSPSALEELMSHGWPGNVRELQNVITRVAATQPDEMVSAAHLRALLAEPPADAAPWRRDDADQIGAALTQTHGRIGEAADLLGVSRSTLWRRMRRLRAA
jgi:transcriptional regulator with PAS, ATPase and Fis domain